MIEIAKIRKNMNQKDLKNHLMSKYAEIEQIEQQQSIIQSSNIKERYLKNDTDEKIYQVSEASKIETQFNSNTIKNDSIFVMNSKDQRFSLVADSHTYESNHDSKNYIGSPFQSKLKYSSLEK